MERALLTRPVQVRARVQRVQVFEPAVPASVVAAVVAQVRLRQSHKLRLRHAARRHLFHQIQRYLTQSGIQFPKSPAHQNMISIMIFTIPTETLMIMIITAVETEFPSHQCPSLKLNHLQSLERRPPFSLTPEFTTTIQQECRRTQNITESILKLKNGRL